MSGLLGKYRMTLDPKGRIIVPAKYRDILGDSFYLALSSAKCLTVYTEEGWQALLDKLNTLPVSQTGKLRFFFANAAQCEPDKQGRFLIPTELRQRVGLTQDVTFVGAGRVAEIWDSATFDEEENACLTTDYTDYIGEAMGGLGI